MVKKVIGALSLLFTLSTTPSVFACDSKSCESAYLASTHKYIKNLSRKAHATKKVKAKHGSNKKRKKIATVNIRRAHAINKAKRKTIKIERNSNYKRQQIAAVNERRAHAINRARRDFALNKHLYRLASHAKQKQAKLK